MPGRFGCAYYAIEETNYFKSQVSKSKFQDPGFIILRYFFLSNLNLGF